MSVYWGTAVTGTLLGTGSSDGAGNLQSPVNFNVPSGAQPGRYVITAIDSASQYPVNTTFTVQGHAVTHTHAVRARSGGGLGYARPSHDALGPAQPAQAAWRQVAGMGSRAQ